MTQGLRRRGTRRNTIVAMMAIACAVATSLVVGAPASSKELDPVLMVTIQAGEFLMGIRKEKAGPMSGRSDLCTSTSFQSIKSK